MILHELERMGISRALVCIVQDFASWFESMSYVQAWLAEALNESQAEFTLRTLMYKHLASTRNEDAIRACAACCIEDPQEYFEGMSRLAYSDYEAAMSQVLLAIRAAFTVYCTYLPPIRVIETAIELAQIRSQGEVCTIH